MVAMYFRFRETAAMISICAVLLLSIGCGRDREDDSEAVRVEAETALDTISTGNTEVARADLEVEELPTEELFYDDGEIDQRNSPWSEQAGGQIAVAFTPGSYPVTIHRVRFFVGSNGIPTKAFRVRVYPGDGSTGPVEEDLLEAEVVAAASYADQWVEVDLSTYGITVSEGDFFVAMEWITPPGNYGTRAQMLGADTSGPDRRSWWKHYPDSEWVRIEEISDSGDRDLMIRATVLIGP
jgi:hypothetical protein